MVLQITVLFAVLKKEVNMIVNMKQSKFSSICIIDLLVISQRKSG